MISMYCDRRDEKWAVAITLNGVSAGVVNGILWGVTNKQICSLTIRAEPHVIKEAADTISSFSPTLEEILPGTLQLPW
jgi:hypothetical protein